MDLALSCNIRLRSIKEDGEETAITTDSEDECCTVEMGATQDDEHMNTITNTNNNNNNNNNNPTTDNQMSTSMIPHDNFHKYCYRHNPDVKINKQTDLNKMNEIQECLEKMPRSDQEEISNMWSMFGAACTSKRNLMLQGILSQCCFPQLSFISQEVSSLIRIDFISTLPMEVSLKILCYLDCASLCNAAQVSKNWKRLADDDRVWHHMCEQHIDRKCPNCGWGLPLMHMKRAREDVESSPELGNVTLSSAPKRRRLSNQTMDRGIRKTRPWKVVYSERFKVERNWRKGVYKIKEFVGHTDGILTLKYGYKYLFTGSYDHTVKMWDISTGKLIRTLKSHSAGVKTLAFDEQKLITGSLDKTIKVWNYHTGDCIATYRGHNGAVLSVDVDNKCIVSGSQDTTVKVWNVVTRTCYALRGHTEAVNSVKIHPQSWTAFSASDDTTIRMWDLKTNKCLKVFKGHVAEVQKVIPLNISPDYKLVEDVDENEENEGISHESQDPDTEAVVDDTDEEGVPNTDEDEEERVAGEFEPLDYSDPSRVYPTYILTASLDNTIKLWDVRTGKCVRTQFGHVEGIWDIAADTFRIVSGAHDRFVKIWDLQSGKCMHTFPGHGSPVSCVGLGDSSFASADESGVVRMFEFDRF